jgi:hypothetical protein
MRQLHDSLWVHEDSMKLGPVPIALRMTVARLANGGLWVHSPTALSAELKRQVDELGAVSAVLGPSNGHNLWLEEWADAYPDATLFVTPGIPKKLPKLSGFEVLDEQTAATWGDDFEASVMGGVPFFGECVFLHRASRSLIVTDVVQNFRGQEYTGFAKVMATLVMRPIGFKDICVAPPLRFNFMIKDRPAFVAFIDAVQQWDFDRIIVTHGEIIEDDAKATFSRLCERWRA